MSYEQKLSSDQLDAFSEKEIKQMELEKGAKRTATRKSIEDRKAERALRAELGDDGLTQAEYHSIFSLDV